MRKDIGTHTDTIKDAIFFNLAACADIFATIQKNAQIFIDSRRILLFGCKELVLTQAAKLEKIASFIVSVFVPMSFLIHLNPRTTEGPDEMLFLRDVVLDYKRINDELVEVIRKMFPQHFHAWMNPTNVALNIQFKILAYKIDHLKNPDQSLPESVDIEALALKRIPMKSFYSKASKQAPSVHTGNITFWNSVDNHNRNGETVYRVNVEMSFSTKQLGQFTSS